MLKITIEKDDFTGFRTINTGLVDLKKFKTYSSTSAMQLDGLLGGLGTDHSRDAFDLVYVEAEDGQGGCFIKIVSYIKESAGWPHWDDNWLMIVDGNRISLNSTVVNTFGSYEESKLYELPVDILNKLCNSKEIKFSLRGKSKIVEGIFTSQHQTLFKAFEQFCFGDESEGDKIIETLNISLPKDDEVSETSDDGEKETWTCFSCSAKNLVPKDWTEFSCHKCGKNNTITKPIKLSPEDIEKHENKTIELIKEKKVSDAAKYYAANFGESEENSKIKVKELAEKNGVASIIAADTKKKAAIGLLFYIPIFSYLCYLGGLTSDKVPMPIFVWVILILIFGTLTLRAIIKFFKK
jgi:hypothetical protein